MESKKSMSEDFVSYVWQFQLFGLPFTTTGGCNIVVEYPGTLNSDSGPDFLNARIRINETLWVGHVEIHLKSSDWFVHGHHENPLYDVVILHVVFNHDKEVMLRDGSVLSVFELKNRIDPTLYTRYLQFISSPGLIACAPLIDHLKPFLIHKQWIVSLGVERMIRRSEELTFLLQRLQDNWLELLYVTFCKSFGNKVNDDNFEMLAINTPLSLIRKYSSDVDTLEALLFGQAGLLDGTNAGVRDEKFHAMHEKYLLLQHKHGCSPIQTHLWKFLRTRPANFPTVRLAQLAVALPGFLKINPLDLNEVHSWMEGAKLNKMPKYWQTHYHFGKKSKMLPKGIGSESVTRIVINGIMVTLVKYGNYYKNHSFLSGLIDFMSTLPPEKYHVIRFWEEIGMKAESALETQGLLELTNEFCRKKQCLKCRFGHKLLSNSVA